MNYVDLLILIWLVFAAARGFSVGLIRQVLSFSGFILGLVIGGWLAPNLLQLYEGPSRLIIAVILTLVLAATLSGLGERLAIKLQSRITVPTAHRINSLLGVFSGTVFVLLASWLIASAATRLPLANVSLEVEQSRIVQGVSRVLPETPGIADQLAELISPFGLPQVFEEAAPNLEAVGNPDAAQVAAAAEAARGSTVRVEGFTCGGISTGSGYVADPNYVVTNAHVVAGMQEPIVLNQGQRQRATVVFFDADLDLAVLRTNRSLPGRPLPLSDVELQRGATVAVIGYPGGGGLRVSPGVVASSRIALGRDIYGSGISSRQIYSLLADVQQGNSGGPVVTADGRVAGIVFGKSTANEQVGYAFTSLEAEDEIATALTRTAAVSSGPCLQQ